MGQPLPKIYDITFFDPEGSEMHLDQPKSLTPLLAEVENEVQFMEMAAEAGADTYKVRLNRPDEIRQRLKEERKAARPGFMISVARSSGLFDIINLITYIDEQSAPRRAN